MADPLTILRNAGFGPTLEALARIGNAGFVPEKILDIGAYTGDFTRVTSAVFPDARFLMVEAQPEAENKLAKLCSSRPESFDFAIALLGADNRCVHPFYQVLSPAGSTGSSIYPEMTKHPQRQIDLRMIRLDDFLDARGVSGFNMIKLDVQGAELDVLRGGPKTMVAAEVILMETSLLNYNRGAPTCAEAMNFMCLHGFVPIDFYDPQRDCAGNLIQIDMAFMRKGSGYMPKLTLTD